MNPKIYSMLFAAIMCLWMTAEGQGVERTDSILMMHSQHVNQLTQAELNSLASVTDVGNVTVINADRKNLISRNIFDLSGKKITFSPTSGRSYHLKVSMGSISEDQGHSLRGSVNNIKIGFTFVFYGIPYTTARITADGLSFPSGVSFSDLAWALNGSPSIFALSSYLSLGQIKMLNTSNMLRITWTVHDDYYFTMTTYQANIFKNGTIELVYDDAANILQYYPVFTGISPGHVRVSDRVKFVDYSATTDQLINTNTAVIERFSNEEDIDLPFLLQQFHKKHPKAFDFVTIFTDRSYGGSRSFFYPVQNSIKGIGLPRFNSSDQFGSSQLQGIVMMNSIGYYSSDPNAARESTTYSTLDLLAKLHGERWIPYVRVTIQGKKSSELIAAFCHNLCEPVWNFFMDTDASVMGGNDIRDNEDGTFITTASTLTYSKLDQYLMGFVPASDVPPFFFVRTSSIQTGLQPEKDKSFSGTKVNLGINQIVLANGPRIPSSESSQKQFREAFIYFTDRGTLPGSAELTRIEKIRLAWEHYFDQKTNHHAKIDTVLR
jgi:hypothetical protein